MLKAQKEGYFNRDLKIRRRWRQRWRGLKAIGLISKTTTLHVHHTYFVRRRCPTTTWNCLFSRFVEDVNKAPDDIFSLFLNLEVVLRNSTPRKFAKNWQSKWLEIIAKIKKTRNLFLSRYVFSRRRRRPRILRSLISDLGYKTWIAHAYCAVKWAIWTWNRLDQQSNYNLVHYKLTIDRNWFD